jgi:hypothetical protein
LGAAHQLLPHVEDEQQGPKRNAARDRAGRPCRIPKGSAHRIGSERIGGYGPRGRSAPHGGRTNRGDHGAGEPVEVATTCPCLTRTCFQISRLILDRSVPASCPAIPCDLGRTGSFPPLVVDDHLDLQPSVRADAGSERHGSAPTDRSPDFGPGETTPIGPLRQPSHLAAAPTHITRAAGKRTRPLWFVRRSVRT